MRAAVALGGALGSVARLAVGEAWQAAGPWVTWSELTVNVTGAFLLAVVVHRVPDPRWRAGLGTGLLGSWTTVSAFGEGVAARLLDGDVVPGLTYALVTVLLGLAAAAAGERLAAPREVAA